MKNSEIHLLPRWQVILRWILLLPASIVSNIVADSLFFDLSSWNLGLLSHIPNILPASVISFLQSSLPLVFGGCAGGVAFIAIGAAVAPRFRTKISMGLLVINTCVASLIAGANLFGLMEIQSPLAVISEFIGVMAGTAGSFYLVVQRVGWESNAPISRLWRPENSVE